MSKIEVDAIVPQSGTTLTVGEAGDTVDISNATLSANLNANNLTSGTIPDARFPATLPAVDGSNLTNVQIVGGYTACDAITVTNTDTFALTAGGSAVSPESANNCIVSLNGVIQAPGTSYTISGSNIVFASALSAGSDVIDFITVLGTALNVGTVSDGTIGLAKLSATGTKDATTFLRGDNSFAEPAVGLTKLASTTVTTAVANVEFDSTYVGDYSTYLLIISAFSAATDGYDLGVQFLQDSTSVTALSIHNWKNMNNSASSGMDTRSDYHEVLRDGEASSNRTAGLVWIVLNNNKTTEGGGAYGFGSTLNQTGDYYGYDSQTIFTSDITLNKIRVLDIAGSNVDSGTFTLYGVTK